MLMQVKEAIVSQKNQNKTVRETATTAGAANPTISHILRNKEWSDQLSNIETPWKDWRRSLKGMIQNYFNGSEKQLHNIEYSQETQIVCNKVQTTSYTEEEQGQLRL